MNNRLSIQFSLIKIYRIILTYLTTIYHILDYENVIKLSTTNIAFVLSKIKNYSIGAIILFYFGDLAINEIVEIKRENREEEK